MTRTGLGALLGAVLMVAAGTAAPAAAQEYSPAGDMMQTLEPFILSAIDFTEGVRLDEGRLTTILEHMQSLDRLGNDDEDDDLTERAFLEGRYDFSIIVKDPEYVAWCKARGLKPLDFFKGLMRLETLVMRDSLAQSAKQMKAQMPQQRKQIEEMRGMLGDDAYRQALAALDSSIEGLDRAAVLVERIPAPSAQEAALLSKYQAQIRAAMGDDEEDDEYEDSDD